MECQYIRNKARLWFDVIALLVVIGLVLLEILAFSAENHTVAWVALSVASIISIFIAFDGDVWLFPDHIIMDIETKGISSTNDFHCDPV